uniref:Uncharacterized protein n=1 Tax=Timema cristinae TaxID=61476 RepID=A0A7R9CXP2_TIMCR|nr:unnamed protein product [Timema cristinae]
MYFIINLWPAMMEKRKQWNKESIIEAIKDVGDTKLGYTTAVNIPRATLMDYEKLLKAKSDSGIYKSRRLGSVHNHNNMKCVLSLCVLAVFLGLAQSDDKYTVKYDNVDLDEILNSDRLLNVYVKCLLDVKDDACTADGKELKGIIPEALTNDCAKCNDKQKEGAKKVINYLRENKPEEWKKLETKFDPDGVYGKKLKSNVKN